MIREMIIPVAKAIMCVLFRPVLHGKDNIPKEGGYILAANHLSLWEGFVCLLPFIPPMLHILQGLDSQAWNQA